MRDPGRARRPGGLTGLVTGLVAAAVVASGCSVLPSGNGPQPASAPPPPAGAGPCCGLVIRAPQAGWSPEVVVKYFLLASAISANNYAVARQYLTRSASAAWRPGETVAILTKEPEVTQPPVRVNGATRNNVLVSGQEQATLNSAGQYQPAPSGGPAPVEAFALQYNKGIYKISGLFSTSGAKVSNELVLTSALFHLEYTPRNLYYWGRNGELVPYPVFVPIQGTNPAGRLINDLISGPSGWLAGAADTAFPTEAHLVQPIHVFPGPSGGRTAVVNIAVPRPSPGLNVQAMAAQLVTTLTSPVYSAPLFRAVELKINGRPWHPPHGGAALRLSTYQPRIPQPAPGAKAYYLSEGGGSLRTLAAQSDRGGATVLRGPGTGQVPLSQIAVSPDGHHLAGLAGPANTVYTGSLVTSAGGQRQSLTQLRRQFTGIRFTSLSWDRLNDLWITGQTSTGTAVWVLFGGQGAAVKVPLPAGLGPVTGLRVAPDGTRVAMIVGTGTKADLMLAAVTRDHRTFLLTSPAPLGPGLPPLTALTWFDEDHLMVVTGPRADSELWEVPVDGDNPTLLIKQTGILTVTAAGPHNPLYLGLAGARLERAVGLNQLLGDITAGQAVIYPG
jgi:Lipoprotein LpqB beta-propeller domain